MTVCVAAITKGAIIGASDRMITSGDVEFEPPSPKIWQLTSSIAAMVAGDAGLQKEIHLEANVRVHAEITTHPRKWLELKDAAQIWFDSFLSIRMKRAERAILYPLALTQASFLAQQSGMNNGLVSQLASELMTYDMPQFQTIITGVDETGPHIYVVGNSGVHCRDSAAFAAIGIGYWHANSQFMFAGHTAQNDLEPTILLTYAAKRRAEVAPGVGEGSDMFSIGPNPGTYINVTDNFIAGLKRIYEKQRDRSRKSVNSANREVTAYVASLTPPPAPQQSVPTSDATRPPSPPTGDGITPTDESRKDVAFPSEGTTAS